MAPAAGGRGSGSDARGSGTQSASSTAGLACDAVFFAMSDLGYAPRLCAQAAMLQTSQQLKRVALVGYASDSTSLPDHVVGNAAIEVAPVARFPVERLGRFGPLLYVPLAVAAVLWYFVSCVWAILRATGWRPRFTRWCRTGSARNSPHPPPPRLVYVLTPPSFPTFLVIVVLRVAWSRLVYGGSVRPFFVVDWVNYGWSIIAMHRAAASCLGRVLVAIVRFGEMRLFGPIVGDLHLTVSKTMARDLHAHGVVNHKGFQPLRSDLEDEDVDAAAPLVVYDGVLPLTHPRGLGERMTFFDAFVRAAAVTPQEGEGGECDGTAAAPTILLEPEQWPQWLSPGQNVFLEEVQSRSSRLTIRQCANRPAVVLSSTSYTPDEDFTVLLEAVRGFDLTLREGCRRQGPSSFPERVLFIITGRGPMYAEVRDQIIELNSKHLVHCAILQVWFADIEDYKTVLGCVDLGVSMHQSSSGVDLPMKVYDMFRGGVPVLARQFPALPELVQNDVTGYSFDTADELRDELARVFAGWAVDTTPGPPQGARRPAATALLCRLEKGVEAWWADWKLQGQLVSRNLSEVFDSSRED